MARSPSLDFWLVFQTEEVGQKDGCGSQTKLRGVALSVTALLTALLLTGCTERTAAEDASADGKRGVYVRLERSDISAIGLRTTGSSLVCENADGSVLHAGEWVFTGGDIAQLSGAENRAVLFTVRAMAKDDTILAEASFYYDAAQERLYVTISEDGVTCSTSDAPGAPANVQPVLTLPIESIMRMAGLR